MLLTANDLFARFFWPHYPPDVRAAPDHFRDLDANPSRNPTLDAHLAEAAELFARQAPRLLGTELPFTAEGVGRLARALDRAKRDALLVASDPADPGNLLFNTVVHGAAFVGEVIVRAYRGRWSLRRPMWESVVLRHVPGAAGEGATGAIPPFHWLLKHLDDREVDHGSLAWRFKVHVELATADVAAFPVIAPPRRFPALKHPSYDLLVKYLHQHLPALRDLGAGFPSPAEFTDRAYAALGFELFHGGRVLALHGQLPPRGERPAMVEVLWLTAHGFDHADAFPCDERPPYFARATGDALEVTLAWHGRPHTHRVAFRGHG
jgi:hypothetical protein